SLRSRALPDATPSVSKLPRLIRPRQIWQVRTAVRPPDDKTRDGHDSVPETGTGSGTGGPVQHGEVGARYRAQRRELLGVGLACLSDAEFTDAVRQAVQTRSRLTISFINPDYVLRGHKTPGLLGKMNRFDIVLPDGWGVVFGGRLLGLPVPDRQGHDDSFPEMFPTAAARAVLDFPVCCRGSSLT